MDARSDNDISALTTDVEAREPFDGIAYLFSVFAVAVPATAACNLFDRFGKFAVLSFYYYCVNYA